jgi:hypothetical protein
MARLFRENSMARSSRLLRTLAGVAVLTALGATAAAAQSTTSRPAFGCFKVTAPQVNIRASALSTADVVGKASRGEVLIKNRRFCALRGFWCPVRTQRGVEGWADKSKLVVAACPARLSGERG